MSQSDRPIVAISFGRVWRGMIYRLVDVYDQQDACAMIYDCGLAGYFLCNARISYYQSWYEWVRLLAARVSPQLVSVKVDIV